MKGTLPSKTHRRREGWRFAENKREASHLKGRRVLELQDVEYEIGVVGI